jgi:metallo-beta-lactamase family protein
MKLKFLGATETVTGSRHLVMTEKGRQILLDCGLYQGRGKETDVLNRKLGLNPAHIEAVILSHAHIDHSGNLPHLVNEGFKGRIYCTPATFDVCRLLLLDSAHIQESDVVFINKRRRKNGQPQIKPLYTVKDAERCLEMFRPVPFYTDFRVNDELSFYFSENGHIIGSAAVNVVTQENGRTTRLVYTGDIGRYSDPLLKPPSVFQQADYIICESTYGDRLHDPAENIQEKLLEIVKHTCIEKRGKLIIPAFSLGRTQEIVFILDKLKNLNELPEIQVYVDSPLSSRATAVVRQHPEIYNDELRAYIKTDPDPFGFPNLHYIESSEGSVALNAVREPCVIISASGMGEAGRVKHHLRNNISGAENTVLISGYCAPGTLGARLIEGQKEVHIFGDVFQVRAEVKQLLSLSAHADYSEMIRYLSCQDQKQVKNIFLVHGERDSKVAFREKLLFEGYKMVSIPKKAEIFSLD